MSRKSRLRAPQAPFPSASQLAHLQRAAKICGNTTKLSKATGIPQPSLFYMLSGERRVYAEAVVAIDRATNGRVSRHDLRPDLWPAHTTARSMSPEAAKDRAFEIAGGPGKLADALGISPQATSQWDVVPQSRVLGVEEITGVSRHDLCPELYPLESGPALSTEPAAEALQGGQPAPRPNSDRAVIIPRQSQVSIEVVDGIIKLIQEDEDQLTDLGEWTIDLTPDAARRVANRLLLLAGNPD